jgi:uncharacterized protein (TIGR03435 family)
MPFRRFAPRAAFITIGITVYNPPMKRWRLEYGLRFPGWPQSAAIGIVSIAAFSLLVIANIPLLRAQAVSDGTPPAFEVASIKKHPPDNGQKMGISMGGPDVSQFRASNVTAKMLIDTAYGVRDFQIVGGPSWIGSEHWDIEAKVDDSFAAQLKELPKQQQQAQQALMIRSLLADRFKLQITRGSKEGTVLALVVAKGGPKLKEVPPPDPQARPGSPAPGRSPAPGPGQAFVMMNNSLVTLASNAVPIASLVAQLSMTIGQQVIDQTGLKGTYQYTLQFSPQGLGGLPPPPGDPDSSSASNTASIFTALQEQLGLKLESTKGPVETITIDHIEEPSPN